MVPIMIRKLWAALTRFHAAYLTLYAKRPEGIGQ